MKKIINREKHLRRYIGLVVTFFVLEFALQGVVIFNGWSLTVGSVVIPRVVNYEALFISTVMIFMGIYYMKK